MLGMLPTLLKGDTIVLNPGILKRILKCFEGINKFFFTDIKYPSSFLPPKFEVDYPKD
jgi:hypothetical protein